MAGSPDNRWFQSTSRHEKNGYEDVLIIARREKLRSGKSRHRRQLTWQDEKVVVCVSRRCKELMFGLGGECWSNPKHTHVCWLGLVM